jgi:hypothetical protein
MSVDGARLLAPFRNLDGGFGVGVGQESEVEPTALAAIALDDADARVWLAERQREDGSFATEAGPYVNDSGTGLAALALEPGTERERALDHVESTRASRVRSTDAVPIDPSAIGWGWAQGTASWVEPTARVLWALRVARPSSRRIADAVAVLRDRECVGGGWNYGNRVVLDEELPPFAQTTAIALIALWQQDLDLEARGLEALRRLWRVESAGGLTLATAMAALRIHGDEPGSRRVGSRLERLVSATGLLGNGIAVAWAALAFSDRLPGAGR